MSRRSKAKRKTARKCHSNGKRGDTGKGGVAATPHVVESRKPLRLFTLDLQPNEILGSHDRLIKDILEMLVEDVRDEMRKLRKKDKKPETVHGKPYTPKDGAFLVELVHPGKRTVTLLYGKNSLYLNGLHVSELWFLVEGCDVPIPPSSQLPYGFKSVPLATRKSGVFKFHEGIYRLNWSGSYLDLRGGMKQPFFHGAAEKAHDKMCDAESLVVEGLDSELQPGMAFFAIFIPECTRFPAVRRWARSQIAPGSVKGVVPPPEHRVLMRSWGTRSDDVYCPNTSIEIRRSVDIIKRNPLKHRLLILGVVRTIERISDVNLSLHPRFARSKPFSSATSSAASLSAPGL